jgi:glutaredoxin
MNQSETIRVFHQPGCSSCLRAKEFVAAHGVSFESVDVLNDPGGMDLMKQMGIRRIPVVSKGDEWVFGENLRDVAKLLGIPFGIQKTLTLDDLHTKLNRVLALAMAHILSVPQEKLGTLNPHRENRDIRYLAFHIFDIQVDFLDALDGEEYTQGQRVAPDHMQTSEQIAQFGREVQARVDTWFATQTAESVKRTLPTLWGSRSVYVMLERAVWHAAQHTRQLEAMLEIIDTPMADRLTASDLADLPLPERVWE